MRSISDYLGSWVLVGVLASVLVVGWGVSSPSNQIVAQGEVCGDHVVAGAVQPHAPAWQPNPVLAGIQTDGVTTVAPYDLSEELGLARHERRSGGPAVALVDYGSSTSLNPIRMC